MHFLRAMRSSNRFPPPPPPPPPFINFSCEGSFFFGQSSRRLSADRLRCEHRRFYMATSVGLVSYLFVDLGPRGALLTMQTSFVVQLYARLARIALRNFASLFSPATISLASLHETYLCARHYATVKWSASDPSQDKLNRDKMADTIVAGAHGVSNSWLQCSYTHTIFLPKFR